MSRSVLALGANIGDPAAQVDDAIDRLAAHPKIALLARATPIVTKPWGKTDQPDFVNSAVLIETGLLPLALLDTCQRIEQDMGRVRIEKWGPRLIDIDMITYDRLRAKGPRLTLPHPFASERDFVLIPMREIAPDMVDWLMQQVGPKGKH